ncbi:MAG: SMC-Scp complex subunit ScpB [Planctomycetes bacterium]|nr:SMC-Scp complex subunit ScpB [Planctomycetota bacterium]
MDDISRELPPDDTGAAPVSERQKGPEELARFERGRIDEDLVVDDRFGGALGRSFVDTDRLGNGDPLADREVRLVAVSDDPDAPGDLPSDEAPHEAALNGASEVDRAETPAEEPEPAESVPAETAAADEVPADPSRVDENELQGEPTHEEPTHEELAHEPDGAEDDIDSDEALAAVAAEAETAEIDDVLGDEEGMPSVPELQDPVEVARVVSVLMLTSREGLSILRLAQACNTSQKLVEAALDHLKAEFAALGLPIELSRVGDTVRWVSGAEAFVYLQRLRGVKKMEKLSPAALETLAVVAYRQPVMRSEIEAIRGVKAGPMLRTLLQHKLIRVAGRADVPGRPLQYGTTQHFLERFGIGSLQELPSVKEWKNLG